MTRLFRGIAGLFDRKLDSGAACEGFFYSMRRNRPKPLVKLSKAINIMAVSPVGGGKTSGLVIPFLQSCPDSCVVVDFKGELARITANHRSRAFGHRVVIIDPYKVVTNRADTFNPLDFIDRDSALALDDCRDLAEALVVRTGQEKEPHWADSAEIWIAAMIAGTVEFAAPGHRSLQTVRSLLTNPQGMEKAIREMCASHAWDGMLSRLGYQLTQFKDKELASTLTTTNRFLRFLDSVAISESTKTSTFNPADLRNKRMTVYLVLPPEHMRAQSALLRMWIGSMMRAVVRGGLQEKNKVHFVLDEAASLGQMDALDDAVDKYRAYGIRCQFYYQSLGQLKKCWPDGKEQTLLSNTSQIFFAVNDPPTAEYVSNRLGEETIIVDSGGSNTGRSASASGQGHNSHGWSSGENSNWQQIGRKLLKPEEVMQLPERIAITFTPGIPPLWTTLIRYYEQKTLEPGWFSRQWQKLQFLTCAAIILGLSIALASHAADKVNNKSIPVPGGPAPSSVWFEQKGVAP